MRTGADKLTVQLGSSLDEITAQSHDAVSDALTYLTGAKQNNFYAKVLNSLNRMAVPGLGTMAVMMEKGKYTFAYDPMFATTVSHDELCATCEHEVLHIILEHIPRYLTLQRVYAGDYDQFLMRITANLAMDMADNELLARNWEKLKHKDKPLGYWVIPENFKPALPNDLPFEAYQRILTDELRSRLDSPQSKLYQMAKAIIDKQLQAFQQALQANQAKQQQKEQEEQAANGGGDSEKKEGDQNGDSQNTSAAAPQQPKKPEDNQTGKDQEGQQAQGGAQGQQNTSSPESKGPQEQKQGDDIDQALGGLKAPGEQGKGQQGQPEQGQGQGQGQGEGQGEGDDLDKAMGGFGQGQGQGQPGQGKGQGQGQGQGQPNPYLSMSPEQLQQEINSLDSVDQEVLKMMLKTLPSHMGWDASNKEQSEAYSHQLSEHGRELIRNALKNSEKSRGTIPGHYMELIRKMLLPPTVPWTQFLHNIVQRTRQTKKQRGMSRPSKKLSAIKKYVAIHEEEAELNPRLRMIKKALAMVRRMPVFPGVRQVNKFTIAFGVDTSGSMGTNELMMALAELQHIQKSDSDVSICVLYSDTTVSKEYWIGPTDTIDAKVTGRGGTDFDPIFDRVKELLRSQEKAPDILVYCTDGYAPPPTVRLPIPVVWLLTPRGQPVCKEAGHITIEMRDYQLGESY